MSTQSETTFPFPSLGAELRVKIRRATFELRVLELHGEGGFFSCFSEPAPFWSSDCGNPVTLSICRESRYEALRFYTVALPLRVRLGFIERRLYLNPVVDMIALLGEVFGEPERIGTLQRAVAELDPEGRELRRIGVNFHVIQVLDWMREGRFPDLDQFFLLPRTGSKPPPTFRGGEYTVEYGRGLARVLKDGTGVDATDSFIMIGKTEIRLGFTYITSKRWTWGGRRRGEGR